MLRTNDIIVGMLNALHEIANVSASITADKRDPKDVDWKVFSDYLQNRAKEALQRYDITNHFK